MQRTQAYDGGTNIGGMLQPHRPCTSRATIYVTHYPSPLPVDTINQRKNVSTHAPFKVTYPIMICINSFSFLISSSYEYLNNILNIVLVHVILGVCMLYS